MEKRARIRKVQILRRRVAIISLAVLILLMSVISFAQGKEPQKSEIENILEKYDAVSITVNPGDTAWGIQSELTPNGDIRELLYLAKVVNKKEAMGNIKAFETILFLVPKDTL